MLISEKRGVDYYYYYYYLRQKKCSSVRQLEKNYGEKSASKSSKMREKNKSWEPPGHLNIK